MTVKTVEKKMKSGILVALLLWVSVVQIIEIKFIVNLAKKSNKSLITRYFFNDSISGSNKNNKNQGLI